MTDGGAGGGDSSGSVKCNHWCGRARGFLHLPRPLLPRYCVLLTVLGSGVSFTYKTVNKFQSNKQGQTRKKHCVGFARAVLRLINQVSFLPPLPQEQYYAFPFSLRFTTHPPPSTHFLHSLRLPLPRPQWEGKAALTPQ